jgi:hypothetical protein
VKVKSISITWEEEDRLYTASFKGGCWALDRPIPSRFCAALHEVWKVLRNCDSDKVGGKVFPEESGR